MANDVAKSFAGLPRVVMEHPDYKSLSGNAAKVLQILAFQFRGHNNGDLTLAESYMLNTWGFRSKGTVVRARDELLERRFIVRTRTGRFTNPGGQCDLFALTWLPIDDCHGKRLEIAPTTKPLRIFVNELAALKAQQKTQPKNGGSIAPVLEGTGP